jgi:DNA-binding CsgD family transcriptional regulator
MNRSIDAGLAAGVSPALAVAVSVALREANAGHLLPLVLTVFAPYAAKTPRSPGRPGPHLVDYVAVRQLTGALHAHRAGAATGPVLEAVAPWFTVHTPGADPAPPDGTPLTTRELEVLVRISDGFTNGEIAADLYLSEDTIKTHARRMFRKLGVTDRSHAVRRGFELGHLKLRRVKRGAA